MEISKFSRNSKLINKKFYQYLLPSVLMVFAMQLGGFLDGILVANLIGNEALSASSLVLPVLYIIQIPGLAIGTGGSIAIANLLGQRKKEEAKKVFSLCLIFGTALSFLLAILGIFVSRPLAKLFADSLANYSYQYMLIYFLTDPIIILALMLGSFVAVDNNLKISSIYYILANVIKIISEIIFIKYLKMSLYGAALSTGFGYFLASIVLIFYVKSKRRLLSFTFHIKGIKDEIKNTIKASLSSTFNMFLMTIQMFIINVFIGKILLNEADILLYGLVANMVFLFELFNGGIIGLISNMCALLYGEKDLYGLKKITKKIYIYNILVTLALMAFIFALPNIYTFIFGYDDLDTMDYAYKIIRVFLISGVFMEINKFSMAYYPSIDKTAPSLITVFLRELVLVLPITLILLNRNGLMGYAISQSVVEGGAVVITYLFIVFYNRYISKKDNKKYKGIFIFEEASVVSSDFSIENEIENSVQISSEISKFASLNNIDDRSKMIVSLAAEEIVYNIVKYGYKNNIKSYIDVSIKKVDNTLILKITDDGLPFDPTIYEDDLDDDKEYLTEGIDVIKKLAGKIQYMRVLNLNNTVVELDLSK